MKRGGGHYKKQRFYGVFLLCSFISFLFLMFNNNKSTLSEYQSTIASWQTYPSKRLIVVQFVTRSKLREFNHYWENHERYLFTKLRNATLLLGCPHDDIEIVEQYIANKNEWKLIEELSHPHEFALPGLLRRYSSHKTAFDILVQPMLIELPHHYMRSPVIPKCGGKEFSLSYVLYSGAVFSFHLPSLPIIQKFDYYLKVDIDIGFVKESPLDIGEQMEERGCWIGHSAVHESSDCETNSVQGLLRAIQREKLQQPKSLRYQWCNKDLQDNMPSNIFFGNFLAFSTSLLLHPEVQKIASFLYNEFKGGYFSHRWGDQAPFVMYACYLLDIPNLPSDPQVCDFSELRGNVFVHQH